MALRLPAAFTSRPVQSTCQTACRLAPLRTASGAGSRRMAVSAEEPRRPVIAYTPNVKAAGPSPKEAPVMHSAVYLLQSKTHSFASTDEPESDEEPAAPTTSAPNNAFEWALSRADAQLNRMETDPDDRSNAALGVVRHPLGQATLNTMQSVATVTAAAGPQILKVALPLGKQILGFSAKALVAGVSAVGAATSERQKQNAKKRSD